VHSRFFTPAILHLVFISCSTPFINPIYSFFNFCFSSYCFLSFFESSSPSYSCFSVYFSYTFPIYSRHLIYVSFSILVCSVLLYSFIFCAVPCLNLLVARMWLRRPKVDRGPVRVGFVVDKVAVGQDFLLKLLSPLSALFH